MRLLLVALLIVLPLCDGAIKIPRGCSDFASELPNSTPSIIGRDIGGVLSVDKRLLPNGVNLTDIRKAIYASISKYLPRTSELHPTCRIDLTNATDSHWDFLRALKDKYQLCVVCTGARETDCDTAGICSKGSYCYKGHDPDHTSTSTVASDAYTKPAAKTWGCCHPSNPFCPTSSSCYPSNAFCNYVYRNWFMTTYNTKVHYDKTSCHINPLCNYYSITQYHRYQSKLAAKTEAPTSPASTTATTTPTQAAVTTTPQQTTVTTTFAPTTPTTLLTTTQALVTLAPTTTLKPTTTTPKPTTTTTTTTTPAPTTTSTATSSISSTMPATSISRQDTVVQCLACNNTPTNLVGCKVVNCNQHTEWCFVTSSGGVVNAGCRPKLLCQAPMTLGKKRDGVIGHALSRDATSMAVGKKRDGVIGQSLSRDAVTCSECCDPTSQCLCNIRVESCQFSNFDAIPYVIGAQCV